MQSACVPLPLAFNASMVGPVIAAYGTQEQKETFLPKTANLDIWWSQGFSEPDAGSDLAGLRCAAVRDGDEYVVNGQKTWTTLGQHGDWIFNLVRTNPEAEKKQAGISFLLIDMTTPGVEVRPIELIDGGYEVNEVWFTDVRVPAANLVGAENQGWEIAKFLLGNERVGVAPVGAVKRVLAHAKEWAGEDTLRDPLVAARFAAIENELLALELTALRVVANSTDGKPHPASSVLSSRARAPAGRQRPRRRARRPRVARLRRRRRQRRTALGARRHPGLPQPPQGLDLRRLQRDPAPDHRPHDPGTLRGIRTWTSSTTTSSRLCATPSAGC